MRAMPGPGDTGCCRGAGGGVAGSGPRRTTGAWPFQSLVGVPGTGAPEGAAGPLSGLPPMRRSWVASSGWAVPEASAAVLVEVDGAVSVGTAAVAVLGEGAGAAARPPGGWMG